MTKRNIAAIVLGFASALPAACAASDHAAVIGKPFKISKSVMQFCEIRPQPMMCEMAWPLHAAFLSETRDAQWAAPMEALIEKSMRVGGKQWVQIRALECRRTRCALEYAVYGDDLDHDADGDEDLERLLEPVGGIMAPELGEGLAKGMIVSVLFWTKRP